MYDNILLFKDMHVVVLKVFSERCVFSVRHLTHKPKMFIKHYFGWARLNLQLRTNNRAKDH